MLVVLDLTGYYVSKKGRRTGRKAVRRGARGTVPWKAREPWKPRPARAGRYPLKLLTHRDPIPLIRTNAKRIVSAPGFY